MRYNILVTGGAGYLGSVLVPELLKLGHNVTVIDSFIFGQNSLSDCCYMDNFNVIKGDVRDKNLMTTLVKDKDVIIPLAALVGAPLCKRDEIGTISINRDAIKLLTEITSKEQRILMPVSNSGYGVGEDGIYCTETSPLKPISLYGITKVKAENIMMDRGNAISFRLATVFGMSPRMRLDLLVNDFTYRAVNDKFIVIFEGHFKRNYIHIRDVARAFIHGIDNFEDMKNEVYNVGLSDANLSKLELCYKIKEHIENFTIIEAPIGKDPDQRNYIVSNEKIEKTGFMPKHSLDMGIKELIKGYIIINNSKYSNV
jgi:nucleoside-diphosphate-sugar epimerase